MLINLAKSVAHNIGVLIVGFIFAFLGKGLDYLFGIGSFTSPFITFVGYLFLAIGFLLRVWATYYFYEQGMKVIRLEPQKKLFTSGPYKFTRNPLYLGGNIFIFLGAVLLLGSPSGIVLTILQIFLVDFMIRREEKQLAQNFGEEWVRYRSTVRRWI